MTFITVDMNQVMKSVFIALLKKIRSNWMGRIVYNQLNKSYHQLMLRIWWEEQEGKYGWKWVKNSMYLWKVKGQLMQNTFKK